MHDYVLRKYSKNLQFLTARVSITPRYYKQKTAVSKRWRVQFRYNQEGVNKTLQYHKSKIILNNQLIQINRIKDHKFKIQLIELLKDAVIDELKNDPRFITSLIYGTEKAKELYPEIFEIVKEEVKDYKTIEFALNEALEEKKGKVSVDYHLELKQCKNRFIKFLDSKKDDNVNTLSTKLISSYLSSRKMSNTSYNNEKARISSMLEIIKKWEYITVNYANNIDKLKSKAKKNSPYPEQIRIKLVEELKKEPILYYYYLHIYYGLMRMTTILKLKVKHVDIENRVFNTDTKTGYYLKYMNDVLYDEVYSKIDFSNSDPEDHIFNLNELIGQWNALVKTKRKYYSIRFKPLKDKNSLGSEYTWNSFRHNAMVNGYKTRLAEEIAKGTPNAVEETLKFIGQFANHKNTKTTRIYLRDISTEIHMDLSGYL